MLEPKEPIYGSKRYASGIMRIAFTKGNLANSKVLEGGVIMGDTEPFRHFGLRQKLGMESWSRNFHNYTLVWKPGFNFRNFLKYYILIQ